MATEIKKGQTVYSMSGHQAVYIAVHDGQHIVAPLLDDGEEQYEGEPVAWARVFAEPPREQLHAEIAELSEKRAKLRQEVNELMGQKREAERDNSAMLAKIKKHNALKRIEDYIDGKFQYFLEIPDYGTPSIKTASDALAYEDRKIDKSPRLLCLFGGTGGNMQWRINRWSDGSGSWSDVIPCETEAEAIEIIRNAYTPLIAAWRKGDKTNPDYHKALRWSDGLPSGWVIVPDDIACHIRSQKIKALQDKAEKAKQELDKASAELSAALSA